MFARALVRINDREKSRSDLRHLLRFHCFIRVRNPALPLKWKFSQIATPFASGPLAISYYNWSANTPHAQNLSRDSDAHTEPLSLLIHQIKILRERFGMEKIKRREISLASYEDNEWTRGWRDVNDLDKLFNVVILRWSVGEATQNFNRRWLAQFHTQSESRDSHVTIARFLSLSQVFALCFRSPPIFVGLNTFILCLWSFRFSLAHRFFITSTSSSLPEDFVSVGHGGDYEILSTSPVVSRHSRFSL